MGRRLAEIRHAETTAGLASLAIPVMLDLPDGSLVTAADGLARISAHIHRTAPDLIITHA